MVLNSLAMAPPLFDFARNQLAHIVQVDSAGHELGEGDGNGDDGLAEVGYFHHGPTARHNARAPAILRPWVEVLGAVFLA